MGVQRAAAPEAAKQQETAGSKGHQGPNKVAMVSSKANTQGVDQTQAGTKCGIAPAIPRPSEGRKIRAQKYSLFNIKMALACG
jgi:hypothetical protein